MEEDQVKIEIPDKLIPVFDGEADIRGAYGGRGCMRDTTPIITSRGVVPFADVLPTDDILSFDVNNRKFELCPTSGAYPKGKDYLYRVITTQEELFVSANHLTLNLDNEYQPLASMSVGSVLPSFSLSQKMNDTEYSQKLYGVNVRSYWQTAVNFLCHYGLLSHQYGQQLRKALNTVRDDSPLQAYARKYHQLPLHKDDLMGRAQEHNQIYQSYDLQPKMGYFRHTLAFLVQAEVNLIAKQFFEHISHGILQSQQFASMLKYRQIFSLYAQQFVHYSRVVSYVRVLSSLPDDVISILEHEIQEQFYKFLIFLESLDKLMCRRKAELTFFEFQEFFAIYYPLSCNTPAALKNSIIHIEKIKTKEWYWDMHVVGNNNYVTQGGSIHHNSGKTRTFAKMTAFKALDFASKGISGVILCGREFMNSLDDSSMSEIKIAIESEPILKANFDIGEKYIRTKDKRIRYIFSGLDRNIDSIKSKARILIAWLDEAENVSENAWLTLVPTIREEGSELWVNWNPKSPESPVHKRVRLANDPMIKCVEINWQDNPWFPEKLNRERLRHQINDPVTYPHVWEGEFLVLSEAQVLNGKWEIKEFEPQYDWGRPLFGADFGFSQDPSTLIKSWVYDECLWIEYEAYSNGIELEDYPRFYDQVPQSRNNVIYADCSRPETISYIRRQGFNIKPCTKWAGSVEDGIAHLRGAYRKIYIHPRCTNVAKEAVMYQYKVDKKTGNILPDIVDDYNHAIDALRYSLPITHSPIKISSEALNRAKR